MLTVRLAPSVKGRAEGYAEALGLSLNALIVVALTEYLDARSVPAVVPSAPSVPAASVAPLRPVPSTGRSAHQRKRR